MKQKSQWNTVNRDVLVDILDNNNFLEGRKK